MSKEIHVVSIKWREADASALDERVVGMNDWLDHTEDLIAMFGDDELATELRSMVGLVKTRRNDVSQAADTLKAIIIDRTVTV
jgi:hypothetical protein